MQGGMRAQVGQLNIKLSPYLPKCLTQIYDLWLQSSSVTAKQAQAGTNTQVDIRARVNTKVQMDTRTQVSTRPQAGISGYKEVSGYKV